jgi:DNA replication protein DnaC
VSVERARTWPTNLYASSTHHELTGRNAACTTALIDRVVHHAEIIAIEGESYRRREAQAAKPLRRLKSKA